jgi:P-type conjugative transfer protein TrbJ
MKILKFISIVILSFMLVNQANAFIFIDLSNLIQNTATALNTANQLAIQSQQLQSQLKDIENFKGNIGQWANTQNLLYQLANQVQHGQALAYQMQDLDKQYRSRFPGYVAPQNYQQSYRSWTQTTQDTLLSTLASAGMQADQFNHEQNTLNQLARLSQRAEGRMQAVQVGNMIATQQVSQLQALRQLVVTQINAQNTYAAYETQKDAAVEAAASSWINATDTTFPGYGKRPTSSNDRE